MTRLVPFALALLLALTSACREPLAANLSRDEATALAVQLEQHGIAAELQSTRDPQGDAVTVLVAPDDLPRARAILLANQDAHGTDFLPSDDPAPTSALLGPSPQQEHSREEARRATALARSLEQLDPDIVAAHVHLALGRSPWPQPRQSANARAAVLLLTRAPLDDDAEPSLRAAATQLVAGSLPELSPEAVTVVVRTAPPRPPVPEPALAPLGPWRVAPASLDGLRWALGGLLALVVLQSALLAFVIAQRRRRAHTRRETTP